MQPHSKLSPSATHSHPSSRCSHTAPNPPSEPHRSDKESDLGSDDDWQLTMGSNSDVEEPEPPISNPPKSDSPDHDPLAVHWHDADEESFVDDVKHPKISTTQPVDPPTNDPTTVALVADFDASLHISKSSIDKTLPQTPLAIPDECDDHSRLAVPAQPNGTWADRPRGNPVPLLSSQTATENSSRQSSPGVLRTPNCVESDSAPTSHGGSVGSGSALPISTSTSSDASDASRRAATKSVSFIPQHVDSSKPLPNARLQEDVGPMPPATFSTSISGSEKSAGPTKTTERKTLGIRGTLRDSKARLTAARLSGAKRQHRITSATEYAFVQGTLSDTTDTVFAKEVETPVLPALRSIPQYLRGESSATRTLSNQRLSTKSDGGYPLQNLEPSQGSGPDGRPLSVPTHMSSPNFGSPVSSQATGITGIAESAFPSASGSSALPTHSKRKVYHLVKTPTKDLSFLECVVEILKGTTAYRRKSFMNVIEGQMWLTSDMQAVQYRMTKKGHVPATHTLTLARVKKVKGAERELNIEMIDQKKSIDFLFQSRERADMWLSALCCLVPSHATVKSRHRKLELRETYDPLTDSWSGKQLSAKKRLNEFILLGSIGRGSFGKVKLALSAEDRQFYAVKVLSKAIMRKQMRSNPLNRSIRDAVSSAPLTIGDVNEIVVMKALNHENVMKMKGVFDDTEEDRLYIVLEFVAKGPIMSSSKLTGADKITEDRARSAFVDVLCGLEYLHSNNIVHRDIKPDNLLQAGNGTVKISDFGAAILYTGDDRRETDEVQNHGPQEGTPAFCAPELCLNEKSPPRPARTYSADIWSLGATLFYMIYGRAPFIASSLFQMYDAICTEQIIFPDTPTVSKSLQSLIQQMLRKSPEERATISSIIRSPWLTENVEVADKLSKIRSALL